MRAFIDGGGLQDALASCHAKNETRVPGHVLTSNLRRRNRLRATARFISGALELAPLHSITSTFGASKGADRVLEFREKKRIPPAHCVVYSQRGTARNPRKSDRRSIPKRSRGRDGSNSGRVGKMQETPLQASDHCLSAIIRIQAGKDHADMTLDSGFPDSQGLRNIPIRSSFAE